MHHLFFPMWIFKAVFVHESRDSCVNGIIYRAYPDVYLIQLRKCVYYEYTGVSGLNINVARTAVLCPTRTRAPLWEQLRLLDMATHNNAKRLGILLAKPLNLYCGSFIGAHWTWGNQMVHFGNNIPNWHTLQHSTADSLCIIMS